MFQGAEDLVQAAGPPLVDPGGVEPQRPGKQEEQDQEEDELQDGIHGHSNHSGLHKAASR